MVCHFKTRFSLNDKLVLARGRLICQATSVSWVGSKLTWGNFDARRRLASSCVRAEARRVGA